MKLKIRARDIYLYRIDGLITGSRPHLFTFSAGKAKKTEELLASYLESRPQKFQISASNLDYNAFIEKYIKTAIKERGATNLEIKGREENSNKVCFHFNVEDKEYTGIAKITQI